MACSTDTTIQPDGDTMFYKGELGQGPGTQEKAHMLKSWSAFGQLQTQNPDTSVALQQQFPEPGVYTVQFNIIQPQPPITNPAVPPITQSTVIKWSVAGNTLTRRVTASNGMSISGVCDAVQVVINDTSPPGLGGTKFLIPYQAGITVSTGVRPSYSQPPLLWVLADQGGLASAIAPGASINVAVPFDAGALNYRIFANTANNSPIIDGQITITQKDDIGHIFVITDYEDRFSQLYGPTTNLTITNHGAVAVHVSVVLGIDG
jgi:hypothetical protein